MSTRNILINSRRSLTSTSPCSFRISNHTHGQNQVPWSALRTCVGGPGWSSSVASSGGWSVTGGAITPCAGDAAPQYVEIPEDVNRHCEMEAEVRAMVTEYQWERKRLRIWRDG